MFGLAEDISGLQLPRYVEEITPEWLTAALQAGGRWPDARAASVALQPVGGGVGFTGSLARVVVTYERPDTGPASLIAKLPSPEQAVRDVMRPFRVYEREVRFYLDVAPGLPVRVPECYFGGMDSADDRYVLLLEDLAPARLGDQLAGCTPEEADLALREMARCHAAWWESPRLATLEWMPLVNDPLQQAAQGVYQQGWPRFADCLRDVLSAEMMAIGEKFATSVNWLQDRFAAMPRTVMHTDFRLDNLLFTDGDNGASSVAIIDWQACTRGGGAMDTGYFLSQSLHVEERRKHEMDLLRSYHNTLIANGVQGYPFERCLDDYRVGVLWGWIVPVFAVANLDMSSERGLPLMTALAERSAAAILDHDAGAMLPG